MRLRWTTCLLMLGLTASAAACGDDDGTPSPSTGTGGEGGEGATGGGGRGGEGGEGGEGGAGGVGGAGGLGGSGGGGGLSGSGGDGGTGGIGGSGGSGGAGGDGGTGGGTGGAGGGTGGAGGGLGGAGGSGGGISGTGGAGGGLGGAGGAGGGLGGADGSGGSIGGTGGAGGGLGGVGGSGGGLGGADGSGGGIGGTGGSGGGLGGVGGSGGDLGGAGGDAGAGGSGGSLNLPDGAACTDDAMCAGNFCNREDLDGWPSGYCISSCEHTGGSCAGHGVCIETGSNGHLCYAACATSSDCRPGYACVPAADGALSCRPACTEDAQCPTRGRCDVSTGLCRIYEAICDDREDNDFDAAFDCDDDDCEGPCAAIAEACAATPPLPPEVSGDTSLGTNTFAAACTGAGREDVYLFVAPEEQSGTLSVALESDTDHGLYVRGACDDRTTELACAQHAAGGGAEPIEVVLSAGEPVTVIVDARAPGEEGPYTLRSTFAQAICGDGAVTRPEQCDDPDAFGACADDCASVCEGAREAVLGVNTGDTRTGTIALRGSCSMPDTREDVYRFTPPADGKLTLALSSATDLTLSVRSSCPWASAELACEDAAQAGVGETPAIETLALEVTGGVPLIIVVDGFWSQADAGPYTLDVSFAP
ncbi:DUF4215 domain-containing protein [Sorangium sp. So ce861]|uniref:DUF4215 domain-containing protein n=1 Tax=Sorangium sp. So ce861 TaxID=3133323 RepID=UPI003F61C643